MGNIASSGGGGGHGRRRHGIHGGGSQLPPAPAPSPLPEVTSNRYVVTAATPYPPQYPSPNQFYPYAGYYQPPPPALPLPHVTLSSPLDHHHHRAPAAAPYSSGPVPQAPMPYVEHQKAVTIRNDVNLKKETLRVEPDGENPGKYLIAFTFDATVAGSISVLYFAKEGDNCNLVSTKENLGPVTVSFMQGLGQKFVQPSGTGIDFSLFDESELLKEGDEVYPLAVKAEASTAESEATGAGTPMLGNTNSQITQAVFEKKEKGEYHVRVMKQILWVNNMRYELQEIYGIGNSVDNEFDGNDPGKECVICLSESRDTTVLPCRHMCMCSGCAKVLRFQTNRCPICRQPIERLLEIKVNNRPEESTTV